jgi:hypothetical protein
MSKPLPDRGWFSVKSAAAYTDFTTRSIENAIHLKQIEFRRVRIKGERFCVRIKKEWLDAWIDGVTEKDAQPARLHPDDIEAIAATLVRLMRAP